MVSVYNKGDKLANILDKKLSEHGAGQCMLAKGCSWFQSSLVTQEVVVMVS